MYILSTPSTFYYQEVTYGLIMIILSYMEIKLVLQICLNDT